MGRLAPELAVIFSPRLCPDRLHGLDPLAYQLVAGGEVGHAIWLYHASRADRASQYLQGGWSKYEHWSKLLKS